MKAIREVETSTTCAGRSQEPSRGITNCALGRRCSQPFDGRKRLALLPWWRRPAARGPLSDSDFSGPFNSARTRVGDGSCRVHSGAGRRVNAAFVERALLSLAEYQLLAFSMGLCRRSGRAIGSIQTRVRLLQTVCRSKGESGLLVALSSIPLSTASYVLRLPDLGSFGPTIMLQR